MKRKKEKRKEARALRMKPAQVIFNSLQSVLDCRLKDISDHGARLSFINALNLPEEFQLTLPGIVTRQWVRRAWSKYDQVGVEFIS